MGLEWFDDYATALNVPIGTPIIIGLRKEAGMETFYGWAELRLGSLTVNAAAFNNQSGGSLSVGQVPEPHSVMLMASGLAGLEALRRRRKRKDATADGRLV